MRIFIITGTFPTEMNKQAGNFIKDQAITLGQAGNEVVVLAIQGVSWRRWNEIKDTSITRVIESNITVYNQTYLGLAQSYLPKIAINQFSTKLLNVFSKAINENGKPDLLYAHFSFQAGIGASILSLKYNIPLFVLEHHSLFLREKINDYILESLKLTIERSTEFMCVSELLKKSIIKLTNTRKSIDVIPNMLGKQFFYKPRTKKSGFVFFSAGNLVKGKAFDILIKSFIKSFSINEDVTLLIGGDGPEKIKLKKIINMNGRQSQIKLLGRLDRENMLENYELCDCFILVSKRETFGIVYREAMAVGRPVISSKNGGISESWSDILGLLTDIDDITDISLAMKKMRITIESYDGEQISNYILKKYSNDAIYCELKSKFEMINNET